MRKVVPSPIPDQPFINDAEDLGLALRAVRTRSGMTLEEAALVIGVSKNTMQNLERGTGTVSLALAIKVSSGLGLRLMWQKPADHRHGA
jgi:DNA-binding XRE family transcriptional regulator